MPNGYNNIRRLSHRAMEEMRASARVGREAGIAEGVNAFRAKLDLQVMNRNGYLEPPAVRSRLVRKHEAVMMCLEKLLGDYARSYDYGREIPPVPEGMASKIWMCWWQGLERAPEIVRACVESVRRNAAGREVVVVTDENMAEYVKFPGWVLELGRKGVLSRTHISDLLRLELLAQYGGLWIDSTFFCCRPLDNPVYAAPLFSVKRPGYLHGSIAAGYFANYSLGCDEAHRFVFSAVRDFFLEYWRKSDYLLDYLLTDYLIVLAQRCNAEVSDAFCSIKPNNSQCDELLKVLGKPYDEKEWHRLRADTDLFKLTWKQRFPTKCDGHDTYYGRLLRGELK